jgi:glycosyltransferase involved in cell wall biosynthesis
VERAPHVGAAEARNYGAARANGDVLVFVDADVVVHDDAMRRIRAAFQDDPELTALFGSYDDGTDSLGRVGTFRNLLHHHVHSTSAGPATTFWTGLGAVRRDAFLAVEGFDAERFSSQASLEDIDLGMRLSARGARIRLDPTISGTHLKDWSLWEMVRTDLLRRGMPWVSLLIGSRKLNTTTLNLSWLHRVSTLMSLLGLGAVVGRRPRTAVGSVACVVGLNHRFYRLLLRRYGMRMATLGVGLHLVHHLVSAASVPAGVVAHLVRARPVKRPGSKASGS